VKRFVTSLGIVAALMVLTAVPLARAADPSPTELKALEIRGQAMNRLCEDSTLTGVGYRALCGSTATGLGPTPLFKALEIRGEAMNHLCDANQGISAEGFASLCRSRAAGQVTKVVGSSGFDWSDFSIGAGAMLGFVLLAGGIAAGVHYGRRSSVHPRPVS
jgi:hypothetical protein